MSKQPRTILQENGGIERVVVTVLPDGRLTREDAARYLGVGRQTLANWASNRGAKVPLKFTRVGNRVYYFKADLDAFINA